MKKLIYTFAFFLFTATAFAQSCAFYEHFEQPSGPDSLVASNSCSSPNDFAINTRISSEGSQCDSAAVDTSCVKYLTSIPFSLNGMTYVTLRFDHICRIDFFDQAQVEVSIDGTNWYTLTGAEMDPSSCSYATFPSQGYFSSASNLSWDPGVPGTVATNAMWCTEVFNLGTLIGNQPIAYIRFTVSDVVGPGSGGYPGWYIDNICVEAAPCELIDPVITQLTLIQGTIYNLGPYVMNIIAQDLSGVGTATLYYTVNGGSPNAVPMTAYQTSNDSTWLTANIPAVNDSDSVCYYFEVVDASSCSNTSTLPTSGCISFIATTGIGFPFCDNFDTQNIWFDSLSTPSQWQYGNPNTVPPAPHSAPNVWEVALNTQYQNNENDYLYSPNAFNFCSIYNASVDLWFYSACENFWDGTRLEWSDDGGANWNILGNVGTGVNWYNDVINSSGLQAWTGGAGQWPNGWTHASHSLSVLDNNCNNIQFRFVFTSDASVIGDGFAIDDFCISVPSPQDAGVTAITSPPSQGPAGMCVPVVVTIQNFGSQAITSTPVTWVQTSGTGMPQTGTHTLTGNLAPGASTTDTILPCFNIPQGAFCLQAYTSLPNDGNNYNDSTTMCGVGIPVLNITTCDDFESGNIGWVASPATQQSWNLGTPAYGTTTGAHSGTNAWDVNLTGPYGSTPFDTLFSPIYNVTGIGNAYLQFWQNRNIASGQDGLFVEYSANGGAWQQLGIYTPVTFNSNGDALNWYNAQTVFSVAQPVWTGSSGGWIRSSYFLSNILAAAPTTLRFRFIFAPYQFGIPVDGVSIDDVCMIIPPPIDPGLTVVASSTLGSPACDSLSVDSVNVSIRNFGSDTLYTGQIYLSINSVPAQNFGPFNWNGVLPPGATAGPIQLPYTYSVPCGAYDICSWIVFANDSILDNDTLCSTNVGVPIIAIDYNNPYCDDFESGNLGWSVSFGINPQTNASGNPGSLWELGTPAFGATSSAHSGTNAWDINLTSAYTNDAYVFLNSPIFDFSNAVDTKLDVWLNRNSEQAFDGTWLDFSVNGGAWTRLGTCNAPPAQATNWYNQCALISNGSDAWSGNFPWQMATWKKLDSYGGFPFNNQAKVQFRFGFTSDASVILDGFSIDDFCLTVPVPLTVHPVTVNTTAVNNCFIFPGQCINITAPINNDGTTAVNGCTAEITIDGVHWLSDTLTFTSALAPGANTTYTSTQCWSASPGLHTVCVITTLPNGQTDLKPVNDTVCTSICVFDTIPQPVVNAGACTDFETDSAWIHLQSITYGPLNSWTWATPAKATINSAHSGTKCWVTDSLSDYPNQDKSSLFTPVYSVVPGLVYNLEYWGNFLTEKNEDGGTVEYSTDYGLTWTALGTDQDPNWMNTYSITALTPPIPASGWSGQASGWTKYDHDICFTYPLTSQVIFRFRFNSDFSVRDEGWAIDDVCFKLTLNPPCALGINDIMPEELQLFQNMPNPFNSSTDIKFNLPKSGFAKLVITNMVGQTVAVPVSQDLAAGVHTVTIDANKLAPGIYYYSLQFGDARLVKKMLIVE